MQRFLLTLTAASLLRVGSAAGQTVAVPDPASQAPQHVSAPSVGRSSIQPSDYVIGVDDVIAIQYWREKELSAEVVVRPDGKISLPLLNDVSAVGLTPQQLREWLMVDAQRFVEDPTLTVVVKQINSRKVFITGQVEKPGAYPLNYPTNVMQLIALAGGIKEFADAKRILIMRTEGGRQISRVFNYVEVLKGKKLAQNIELTPGDTIIVP